MQQLSWEKKRTELIISWRKKKVDRKTLVAEKIEWSKIWWLKNKASIIT